MEWSSLKGRGPRWFTIRKNRPALQRRDILTVSLVSFMLLFFFYLFLIGHLLRSSSSSTQFFLVALFFLAFYTVPFSSKHFFLILGLFLRSLSTQLFFLVVLLLLLLSMTAFYYVGLLSLFWVWLFHAFYQIHLPPSSFLEGLSSEQFAELRSIQLLALILSSGLFFGFPVFRGSVLSNLQCRFDIFRSFVGFVLRCFSL